METKHHRKPRSLGGADLQSNLSYVPQKHHRAWHNLMGNMSAPEIARKLGKLFPDFYFIAVPRVPLYTVALSQRAHYTKSKALQDRSIEILWGKWSIPMIVHNINERWLDRDYCIHALKIVSPLNKQK